MRHMGDITKIRGYEAPVVDCIIGGSPCQDLSVAGKRAGLAGERSGLYMEQIRIIKEMRHKDEQCGRTGEYIRPRYMVWENVPGAFSSNKGKDFAAVLEEAIRVAEPEAPNVPVPKKGWPTSGCFLGDDWSVAWRVLDAQFWGVPQRRRRIALVADFGGQSAPEILFVRKSVSGNLEPGEPKRKEAPGDAESGAGTADCEGNGVIAVDQGGGKSGANFYRNLSPTLTCTHGGEPAIAYTLKIRSGCEGGGKGALIQTDKSATLSTLNDQYLFQPICMATQQGGAEIMVDKCPCITASAGMSGNNQPVVCYSNMILDDQGGSQISVREDGKCPTLRAEMHGNIPAVMTPMCIGNGQANAAERLCTTVGALNCMHDQQVVLVPRVAHTLRAKSNCDFREDSETYIVSGVDCRNATEYPELNGTIQAKAGGVFSLNCNQVVRVKYIVRRLTPLECERLQGFPDGWTDIGEWVDSKGKKHKEADSPRYKALGNSIAIPPWKWVLKRICACYERDATMASLFDGIGGFPLIWEQLNGKGSCLWASEIEEFPMAVTKIRFGGSEL